MSVSVAEGIYQKVASEAVDEIYASFLNHLQSGSPLRFVEPKSHTSYQRQDEEYLSDPNVVVMEEFGDHLLREVDSGTETGEDRYAFTDPDEPEEGFHRVNDLRSGRGSYAPSETNSHTSEAEYFEDDFEDDFEELSPNQRDSRDLEDQMLTEASSGFLDDSRSEDRGDEETPEAHTTEARGTERRSLDVDASPSDDSEADTFTDGQEVQRALVDFTSDDVMEVAIEEDEMETLSGGKSFREEISEATLPPAIDVGSSTENHGGVMEEMETDEHTSSAPPSARSLKRSTPPSPTQREVAEARTLPAEEYSDDFDSESAPPSAKRMLTSAPLSARSTHETDVGKMRTSISSEDEEEAGGSTQEEDSEGADAEALHSTETEKRMEDDGAGVEPGNIVESSDGEGVGQKSGSQSQRSHRSSISGSRSSIAEEIHEDPQEAMEESESENSSESESFEEPSSAPTSARGIPPKQQSRDGKLDSVFESESEFESDLEHESTGDLSARTGRSSRGDNESQPASALHSARSVHSDHGIPKAVKSDSDSSSDTDTAEPAMPLKEDMKQTTSAPHSARSVHSDLPSTEVNSESESESEFQQESIGDLSARSGGSLKEKHQEENLLVGLSEKLPDPLETPHELDSEPESIGPLLNRSSGFQGEPHETEPTSAPHSARNVQHDLAGTASLPPTGFDFSEIPPPLPLIPPLPEGTDISMSDEESAPPSTRSQNTETFTQKSSRASSMHSERGHMDIASEEQPLSTLQVEETAEDSSQPSEDETSPPLSNRSLPPIVKEESSPTLKHPYSDQEIFPSVSSYSTQSVALSVSDSSDLDSDENIEDTPQEDAIYNGVDKNTVSSAVMKEEDSMSDDAEEEQVTTADEETVAMKNTDVANPPTQLSELTAASPRQLAAQDPSDHPAEPPSPSSRQIASNTKEEEISSSEEDVPEERATSTTEQEETPNSLESGRPLPTTQQGNEESDSYEEMELNSQLEFLEKERDILQPELRTEEEDSDTSIEEDIDTQANEERSTSEEAESDSDSSEALEPSPPHSQVEKLNDHNNEGPQLISHSKEEDSNSEDEDSQGDDTSVSSKHSRDVNGSQRERGNLQPESIFVSDESSSEEEEKEELPENEEEKKELSEKEEDLSEETSEKEEEAAAEAVIEEEEEVYEEEEHLEEHTGQPTSASEEDDADGLEGQTETKDDIYNSPRVEDTEEDVLLGDQSEGEDTHVQRGEEDAILSAESSVVQKREDDPHDDDVHHDDIHENAKEEKEDSVEEQVNVEDSFEEVEATTSHIMPRNAPLTFDQLMEDESDDSLADLDVDVDSDEETPSTPVFTFKKPPPLQLERSPAILGGGRSIISINEPQNGASVQPTQPQQRTPRGSRILPEPSPEIVTQAQDRLKSKQKEEKEREMEAKYEEEEYYEREEQRKKEDERAEAKKNFRLKIIEARRERKRREEEQRQIEAEKQMMEEAKKRLQMKPLFVRMELAHKNVVAAPPPKPKVPVRPKKVPSNASPQMTKLPKERIYKVPQERIQASKQMVLEKKKAVQASKDMKKEKEMKKNQYGALVREMYAPPKPTPPPKPVANAKNDSSFRSASPVATKKVGTRPLSLGGHLPSSPSITKPAANDEKQAKPPIPPAPAKTVKKLDQTEILCKEMDEMVIAIKNKMKEVEAMHTRRDFQVRDESSLTKLSKRIEKQSVVNKFYIDAINTNLQLVTDLGRVRR
ncbi:hypothetical protein PROFUN_02698 [Planoprotostelium fungivorum]|uniref:Uncharacterized protein n=1 Tax=Planoprotostelium fungivorum TaxID=1890364 RepID=A0A2P6NVG8_9EUKA|nr:hypothetical protein PROFUN_02698 [Planoprotostelium fungivorum]